MTTIPITFAAVFIASWALFAVIQARPVAATKPTAAASQAKTKLNRGHTNAKKST